MPRRPAAPLLTACALAAAWLTPLAARADAPQVSAALLFLQASCGLKDAKMEARRTDGRLLLTLRTPQFTRQTNLVHNDLRLFTEESMKRNAEMPPELGACFYPASNQVINVLMELPAQVASLPMAPPPAATPAPQGGGYVPPMVSTPAPAPTVVQATPAPAAAPAPAAGESGGPLQVNFGTMEMNPERYSNWQRDIIGTIGIDIRNNTAGLLRVAVIDPWPVVQLEGGLRVGFKAINGMAIHRQANVSNCAGYASQFTTIRPGQTLITSAVFELNMGGRDAPMVTAGRLAGELIVLEESTNRCTVEPLSTTRINIKMNR